MLRCSAITFLCFFCMASLAQGSSPPSFCGNLSIYPPFRLTSGPSNYGNSSYELLCKGNTTILSHHSVDYYVKNISYEDLVMRLVDVSVASGACRLPSLSFPHDTFASSDSYNLYDANRANWAIFVNCSKKIDSKYNYRPVTCLSGNNSYVYSIEGIFLSQNDFSILPRSCSFITITPESSNWRPYQDVFENLNLGFNVTWSHRLSRAEVFSICWKRLRWEILRDLQGHSFFNKVVVISDKFVPGFLDCLAAYIVRSNDSKLLFALSFILPVLYIIVTFRVALTILTRLVFGPLTILGFLAHTAGEIFATVDHVEKFLQSQNSLMPTRYSYTDIIGITSHFKVKLGQGGFGSVFKGILPGGRLVAVKMLGNSTGNGDEFISEVATIGRIHHINIVQLVGFCSEGPKRALVYEYMPKGSLDKYIFWKGSDDQFSLEKLYDIALGVARGINYLHSGCDMRILHFDIKPHNILLDGRLIPKIGDFGLAKLYPKDYSLITVSAARGTIGYIAPELVSRSFGVISDKSDVYSFGMLLLEMAGRRRNVDPQPERSSKVYYPSWVHDKLNQMEVSDISESFEIDELEKKLAIVGLWCIQMRPDARPSMVKVIEMLEADVDTLSVPPKPFLCSSQVSPVGQSQWSSSELSTISEQE